MDLVQEDQREVIFSEREEDLKKLSKPLDCTCFRTSIWDETLYKAWSSIVYMLIPNVKDMESSLNEFAEILDADEVSLTLQMKNALPIRDASRRFLVQISAQNLSQISTISCQGLPPPSGVSFPRRRGRKWQ